MKIAKYGFVSGRTLVRRGEVVADTDPRIEIEPAAFRDADEAVGSVVEQATAAPGEVRAAPKRATKKAASTA